MEGRVVLKNEDMVAVRVIDGTYSVFRLKSSFAVEIGDVFFGPLSSLGYQLLQHRASAAIVEAQVKLAGSQVAAKTKQLVGGSNRR
jgi:hypothetical protein